MNLGFFYTVKCKNSLKIFLITSLKKVYFNYILHKNIIPFPNVKIDGIEKIVTGDKLTIGAFNIGFAHDSDITYLNIRGSLKFNGKYNIGRGCRFDIGPNAKVVIGRDGSVNPNTTFIISNSLTIGDKCIISWNCQLLDSDFHELYYENKKSHDNSITIGNNVWIGNSVFIYKGTKIPDGCVVAANSVVRGIYTQKNTLIGGNPAKVLKENVTWKS